jgi:hypothetical protein
MADGQSAFGEAIKNIHPHHVLLAHFPEHKLPGTYSPILRKWMISDTKCWHMTEKKAKRAMEQNLSPVKGNANWTQHRLNVYLKKEDDGTYSPIVAATFKEADRLLDMVLYATDCDIKLLSDNDRELISKCSRITEGPRVSFQIVKTLQF